MSLYARAILEERRRRNRAEFALPETVCGVEVRPLTLADISIMQEAGISFFDDSDERLDTPTSLVMLLWWQWVKRPRKPSDGLKRRFARAVGQVSLDRAEKEVDAWLKWQFADSPPSKGGKAQGPPLTSFAVAICDAISSRVGWRRSEVMDLPLPILWQHLKLAALAANPNAPRFNPSDRARVAEILGKN